MHSTRRGRTDTRKTFAKECGGVQKKCDHAGTAVAAFSAAIPRGGDRLSGGGHSERGRPHKLRDFTILDRASRKHNETVRRRNISNKMATWQCRARPRTCVFRRGKEVAVPESPSPHAHRSRQLPTCTTRAQLCILWNSIRSISESAQTSSASDLTLYQSLPYTRPTLRLQHGRRQLHREASRHEGCPAEQL